MRVRTVLTLSTGAAIGAGAMYLLDPDHGTLRRRETRRRALRSTWSGVLRVLAQARRRAEELATATVAGYHEARAEATSPNAPSSDPASGTVTSLDGRRAG